MNFGDALNGGGLKQTFWQEKEKNNKKIILLFFVLLLFYVLFSSGIGFIIYVFFEHSLKSLCGLNDFIRICAFIGVFIGIIHYFYSKYYGVNKIIKSLNAVHPSLKDTYHKRLINIVEELSIAAGIEIPEVYVIKSFGVNCLTIADDKKGRIFITEGAVSVLKRDELQAVIAHSISHISTGDARIGTIAVSIAGAIGLILNINLFDDNTLKPQFIPRDFRVIFLLVIISAFSMMASFICGVICSMISVNRKYLADAISVQLTRNPEALASALIRMSEIKKSKLWLPNNSIAPVCVVPPGYNIFGEGNIFSDIFSVHPPVSERIKRVTGKSKEEFTRYIMNKETKVDVIEEPAYYAYKNYRWEGPFTLSELENLGWVGENTYLCKEGSQDVNLMQAMPWFYRMLIKKQDKEILRYKCPMCNSNFVSCYYEGITIAMCSCCAGVLLERYDLQKIILREEMRISSKYRDDYLRFIESIKPTWELQRASHQEGIYKCLSCGKNMHKGYYSAARQIIIDECKYCGKIFLHRGELEKLQIEVKY
ncbi:MAG: M48 family metalloprotease [Candidatus Hydrogenedentota bacterium]